ncbi:hypothetical protein Esti_005905 [Eimeria stiedai]
MEEAEGASDFCDTTTVRKFALTEEGIAEKEEVLRNNDSEMEERQKAQILQNTVRHWDLFYKRNTDHFFKDRAWLSKELPEIAAACREAKEAGAREAPLLIDVGCGVGNALVPILLANPRLQGAAFDCSPRAVAILRERWAAASIEEKNDHNPSNVSRNEEANRHETIFVSALLPAESTSQSGMDLEESRLRIDKEETAGATQRPAAAAAAEAVAKGEARIFHYPTGQLRTVAAFDITAGDVPREIAEKGSGTFVLLIFVLSAMHPQHHGVIARRCAELLKPGGVIFFRDYGRFDMAQLRFAEQRKPKIEQNLYARYDGTLAYYFLKGEVEELFCKGAGLEIVESR